MKAQASRTRRILKIAARTALVLVAVMLALIVLLLLEPVRNRLLNEAIERGRAALPGTFTVGQARWPGPGRLELENLLWTDEDDTLLAARRVTLSVALAPLLQRDVRLHDVVVEDLFADIPGIATRLAPQEPAAGSRAEPTGPPAFPREGSLPPIPSVAAERFELSAGRILLAPGQWIHDATLTASFDLGHGRSPRIDLQRLAAAGPPDTWRLDGVSLKWDPDSGVMEGSGSGRIAPDWPVLLDLATAAPDSFHLVLVKAAGGPPPAGIGLDMTGRLLRDGRLARGMTFRAELTAPGVEELATLPNLAASLQGLPPLAGITGLLAGQITWRPEPEFALTADLRPNAWCDGGHARIDFRAGRLAADSVSLRLPDLAISAEGRRDVERLDAQVDVRISGARWLQILQPEAKPPDSLAANITLNASGSAASPVIQARLTAAARQGSFVLDSFALDATLPTSASATAELSWSARAAGHVLTGSAGIESTDQDVTVRMTPLWIQTAGATPQPPAPPAHRSGTVQWSQASQTLSVKAVGLEGAMGRLRLDGTVQAQKQGEFRLSWTWNELPASLQQLVKLEAARRDTLQAQWRQDGPYELTCVGRFARDDRGLAADLAGSWRLPGPRNLLALLPPGARVGDLGPCLGNFAFAMTPNTAGPTFRAACDLAATSWLEEARIAIGGHGGTVQIDTCRFAWEGLQGSVSGEQTAGVWDVHGQFDLLDAGLLRRFAPEATADLELQVTSEAFFRGTFAEPSLQSTLAAQLATSQLSLPSLSGRIDWDEGLLAASLRAPRGAVIGEQNLDTLAVTYRTTSAGQIPWPGHLTVLAEGEEVGIWQAAALDRQEGLDLRTDSLALHFGPYALSSRRPFHLRVLAQQRLQVDDLELTGDMGQIAVNGFAGPDSSNLSADVDLNFPAEPTLIDIPTELWPESLRCNLRLWGTNQLKADLEIGEFDLGGRQGVTARLDLQSDSRQARAAIELADAQGDILTGRLDAPATVTFFPPAAGLREGPLEIDLGCTNFPLPAPLVRPWSAGADRRDMLLNAEASVRGSASDPVGQAVARISFPGWPKLGSYTLSSRLRLAKSATATAGSIPASRLDLAPEPPAPPAMEGAGLTGSLLLTRQARSMLTGEVSLPVDFSLLPAALRPDSTRAMRLHIVSEELPLNEFDPLLPASIGLEGTGRIKLTADGPADDPLLDGNVTFKKTRVSLADGTRVALKGGIDLSGAVRSPSIKGRIEIENGVIRIPEPPKNLHPTQGRALLLTEEVRPAAPQAASGTAVQPPETDIRAPAQAAADSLALDLDVSLLIPSGLWLRGQGLEVELAGDLQLTQKGPKPAVTGQLQAVRGFFRFLGRTFFVDRGLVSFYGEEQLDPELDLLLSCQVDETKFWVKFGGTLLVPKLELTSEPEMPEGDIMSYLLFGRQLNELSSDQMNLVQQRATDVVTLFGTAQLEARLSQQLGVDMVTIRQREGQTNGSSLVIGKYLSRRALLKYEQVLGELSAFFINLEYYISRHFKLETMISRQEQSGIEFNWSYEY